MNHLQSMKVMFVGTGGQGVLTAARLLCDASVALGHEAVSGQLHGMAQRAGSVQSSVLIDAGTCPVISEGELDFLIGFEPIETVRALPYLSEDSTVYMNLEKIPPFVLGQRHVWKAEESDKYPDLNELIMHLKSITPRVFCFNGSQIAETNGSLKSLNMVMLGCLLGSNHFSEPIDGYWHHIGQAVPAHHLDTNARAFLKGVDQSKIFLSSEQTQ